MANTSMMTVRIDTRLLKALKARAKKAGRSTSAEVVRIVEQEVKATATGEKPKVRSEGMFSHLRALTEEDIRDHKAEVRKLFEASITRTLKQLDDK